MPGWAPGQPSPTHGMCRRMSSDDGLSDQAELKRTPAEGGVPEGTYRISSLRIDKELKELLVAVRKATAAQAGLPDVKGLHESVVLRSALELGLGAMAARLGIEGGAPLVPLTPEAAEAVRAAGYLYQRGALPRRAIEAIRTAGGPSHGAVVAAALVELVQE